MANDSPVLKHDSRLDKLSPGQYRILRDGQRILVPKGQSISKPLTPETVGANHRMYGTINKGYFMPPFMDFVNDQVDTERFDRFQLAIWREFDPSNPDEPGLPYNDPTIDYHYDLGLNRIVVYAELIFSANGIVGSFEGQVGINWIDGDNWVSENLHFNNFDLTELYGEFLLVVNPDGTRGQMFDTGGFIQAVNLPVTAIVYRATIKNGNSKMPLLLQNEAQWPLTLLTANISVIGGE